MYNYSNYIHKFRTILIWSFLLITPFNGGCDVGKPLDLQSSIPKHQCWHIQIHWISIHASSFYCFNLTVYSIYRSTVYPLYDVSLSFDEGISSSRERNQPSRKNIHLVKCASSKFFSLFFYPGRSKRHWIPDLQQRI
jgi:hypothetical protein